MPHNREFSFHYFRQDLKAGITVFFVALPLCLAISLSSNTPIYAGLIAGIVGGIVVTMVSGSHLSVSGPAAGLTAISAAAIAELGGLDLFFVSVAIAGCLQILLGILRLGGFTHFIPSSVIKGMLAAIGVLLIIKQLPLLVGYDQPEFWTRDLFNLFSFSHGFENIGNFIHHSSAGTLVISISSLLLLIFWKRKLAARIPAVPASFVVVVFGSLLAWVCSRYVPSLALMPEQFVQLPANVF